MNRIFHFISILLLISEQVTAHSPNLQSSEAWVQLDDYLTDPDEDLSGLGYSVASSSDGSIAAYGSPFKNKNKGQVAVHKYDSKNGWVQMGQAITGYLTEQYFGFDVALSYNGQILVASAPRALGGRGYVRVFRFDYPTDTWEQIGEDIEGKIAREELGFSVAITKEGNYVALGAPNPTYAAGSSRVYQYNENEWNQVGSDIKGENIDDESGHTVDILKNDGEIYLAVGAPLDLEAKGTATVFILNRGTYEWDVFGGKYVDGDAKGTNFGRAVSLGHNGEYLILAVGFPGPGIDADSNIKSGVEVYSIDEDSGFWDYYGDMILPKEKYDNTGFKVSLSEDGQMLAIASPDYDEKKGMIRIYKYNKNVLEEGTYEQVGDDIIGEEEGDELGFSLAMSRDGKVVTSGCPESVYVVSYVSPESKIQEQLSPPGISAFNIVLLTFFIAGLVVLAVFVVGKGALYVKNRGSVEFTSISRSNNDDQAPGNRSTASFPVQGQDVSAPVPVPNNDYDDDVSDGSYGEEEDMDYETHLRKIT